MSRRMVACVLMVAALEGLAAAADSAPNTLSDSEKAAGWKLLFDGKTTNGWRNYQKPDIAAGWKVEAEDREEAWWSVRVTR